MTKLLTVAVTMIGVLSQVPATQAQEIREGFAVYLADISQDGGFSLGSLELADQPLFTERDMVSYSWSEHTIELKPQVKLDMPGNGQPFVIVVNGERIYFGSYQWPLASALIGTLHLSFLSGQTKVFITLPSFRDDPGQARPAMNPDPRSDLRVRGRLAAVGLLRE